MADRVTFTRPAAERIGKVVRIVEAGDRQAAPYAVGVRLQGEKSSQVKFCSWSQTWEYSESITITFDVGNATATANNFFLGVGPGDGWVAKNGTSGWQLIGCDLTKQPGYDDEESQLFGHDANEIARWYSIFTCATAST